MAGLEAGFESSAERERRKHDGSHKWAAYARVISRIGDGAGRIAADRRGADDQKLLAPAAGRPRPQSKERSDNGGLAISAKIQRRAPAPRFPAGRHAADRKPPRRRA